ncbi:hypothetical protein V492_00765 [Pseudogymnoascus sp. VKM F-4246]|nr:hypothetical protein V492_00765 [Pseudogymnoascus sp. VKM F-4246]
MSFYHDLNDNNDTSDREPSDVEYNEDLDDAESLASLASSNEEHTIEQVLAENTRTDWESNLQGGTLHRWVLIKWTNSPVLESSWEHYSILDDYPAVRENWESELKRQGTRASPVSTTKTAPVQKAHRAYSVSPRDGLSSGFSMMGASMQRYLSGGLFLGLAIATSQADPSPPPSNDLICHTSNPAECYPKVFEPTEDFQVIHDDQDIPPGLHVRMDIYSGLKQARLNIPMEGESDNSDIPTEQAMVIVDQPEEEVAEEKEDPISLRDKSGKKPPAYQAAGKILPPREPDGGISDVEAFQNAVAILDSDQADDYAVSVTALTTLLDLSHDIYYGVELMKNSAVIRQLTFCLDGTLSDAPTSASRRRLAAGVIANSIQNNPTALEEAQKSWRSYLPYPHSASSSSALQEYAADQEFLSRILLTLRSETDPGAAKAKVNALSGLVKSPELRDALLHLEGLETPLELFARPGEEWDVVRKKIAEFVTDNFLDEDMGAEAGKWPTKLQRMDYACVFKPAEANVAAATVGDECWVYHVMNYVLEKEAAKEDDGWSKPFLQMLRGETEKLDKFVHQEL